jgi:hypothetical protein
VLSFGGVDLATVVAAIGILMILITLLRYMLKLGDVGASLLKWLLIGMLCLVLIWALYNKVGVETGWWKPISLDEYFKPLTDLLYRLWDMVKTAVQRFIEWLTTQSRSGS